jgi:F-type H+-transporting ATPase subunit c
MDQSLLFQQPMGVRYIMKALKVLALVIVVLLLLASPAMAQEHVPGTAILSGKAIGAGLGAGLVLIGAGWGFGRIGSAALESMGRQPEVAGNLQTAMIIIAALLEGATFFALLVCLLVNYTPGF